MSEQQTDTTEFVCVVSPYIKGTIDRMDTYLMAGQWWAVLPRELIKEVRAFDKARDKALKDALPVDSLRDITTVVTYQDGTVELFGVYGWGIYREGCSTRPWRSIGNADRVHPEVAKRRDVITFRSGYDVLRHLVGESE